MSNLKRPRDFAQSQSGASNSASTGKRVKFGGTEVGSSTSAGGAGEVEDDLELDLNDSSNRKRDVVTDGYDSDSSAGSDGGFGGGGGRQGKVKQDEGADAEEDDDDDMFGGGDGGAKAGGDGKEKKAKAKEFLEMGDIEGQEFGKGDDGDEIPEDEEEDYYDEDDLANNDEAPRGKRNKAGMGYKLSSFNMQDELADGRFSADGTYVQNATDPAAKNDIWLDGVSKAAIKAARASKKRMEEDARRREEEEAKGATALAQERDDCLIGMLSIVREGETVAQALSRLGTAKKKAVAGKPKKPVTAAAKQPNDADAMELDDAPSADIKGKGKSVPPPEEDPLSKKINLLTHYASTLLSSHNEIEIYDQSYDDIIKTLKQEGAVRRDWIPPKDPDIEREEAEEAATRAAARASAAAEDVRTGRTRPLIARPSGATSSSNKRFWYKWKSPPPGQPADQEYGPYGHTEISQWIAGGYFGDRGSNINVRVDGQTSWGSWEETSS
ncbi:hypothetical protein T439DRAFT_377932 [Meredithblackwellia eburnea MCA 4105]